MKPPVQRKALRDGFAEGIVELGGSNPKVFVLAGDLAESTRADRFQKLFPQRFLNMGIAEQDMLGTAVGLSLSGWTPFVCSFSCFVCARGYDQIRISICYNNRSVKIAGSHSGITVGADGATAQALEDIAMMRVLPNMTVIVPADAVEARKATVAAASTPGPVFLRLGRSPEPVVTADSDLFQVGRANVLRNGGDVTLVACGRMVAESLLAAEALAEEGIQAGVLNLHTVKPIDENALVAAARRSAAVVTAEEHQVYGGMGSAVAEVLGRHFPVPLDMVGVKDTFGESGEADELREKYGLTWRHVRESALKVIARKNSGGLG